MANTAGPQDLLVKIKPRTVSWTDVVRVLTALEATSSMDAEGRPWARVVATASGYGLNQLRKMQRSLKAIEQLSKRNEFDVDKLLRSVPFSHVEVLARIAKADEQRGLKLIRDCMTANRLLTYRELLEQFYEVRDNAPQLSSVAAGQRAARKFEAFCFDLLSQTNATILPGFSGRRVKVVRWSGGLRYASPDLVIAFRDEKHELIVDAVDCYSIYGDVGQDETAKRMARVAVESTFFRNFWILMPPWSPAWLVRSMCEELRLQNVGIIVVDPETKGIDKHQAWAPSGKAPVPDRQSTAATTMKRLFRNV